MPYRCLYQLSVCLSVVGVSVWGSYPHGSQLYLSYLSVFILLLVYVGLFGSNVGRIVARI